MVHYPLWHPLKYTSDSANIPCWSHSLLHISTLISEFRTFFSCSDLNFKDTAVLVSVTHVWGKMLSEWLNIEADCHKISDNIYSAWAWVLTEQWRVCRHTEWEVLGSFRYLIMVNVFAALYASPASAHSENVVSLLGTRKQLKIGWNIIHRGLLFQIITFRFSHLILPMHISQHTYRHDFGPILCLSGFRQFWDHFSCLNVHISPSEVSDKSVHFNLSAPYL